MRLDDAVFEFMHRKALQAIERCEGRQCYAWVFLLTHYAKRCAGVAQWLERGQR